jgi:hypothetical protein
MSVNTARTPDRFRESAVLVVIPECPSGLECLDDSAVADPLEAALRKCFVRTN